MTKKITSLILPAARRWRVGWVCLAVWLASPVVLLAAEAERAAFDEEMSGYKQTEASGDIAGLDRRLERGESKLAYDSAHGYLLSLLRELNVPVSSQLLVASKTSPNRAHISPKTPRALYFNQSVSIAYVPEGELIEVAATDPKLGVVFYTLEQKAVPRPRLVRDNRCLECHASSKTLNVPGLLARSFATREDGDVDMLSGIMVNHRTPIAERWGGYYVTGTHGVQTHRGNLFGSQAVALHQQNPLGNANVTDLKPFLDTTKYPEPGSDIVALLVLEHQAHMQNLLIRLGYEAMASARDHDSLRAAYPAVEAVLKYMLFIDETRLSSPVCGTSGFTRWFEQQGVKDKAGRSLYEFDLRTRLFKFPCSYMIYSPSFDALPAQARKHLYRRLWEIVSGEDSSHEFRALSADTRKAVREILIATKPELPAYWRL